MESGRLTLSRPTWPNKDGQIADKLDLSQARQDTRRVYEQNAAQWDSDRPRNLYERKWLEHFAETLPEAATILDLGCGAGEPVCRYFIENGFAVTGVDYARSMIDLAAARFPEHRWLVQDMRDLQLQEKYDGVISWDGLFHLSQPEQRQFFDSLPNLLKDEASFLMTIGTGDGEVTGTVAGQTVYHASLSVQEYRSIMQPMGFSDIEIILEDEDALGRSILFATRKAGDRK